MRTRARWGAGALWACMAAGRCLAQSTEPVGPAGWTARNWAGFALQITLFSLALLGICALGRRGGK